MSIKMGDCGDSVDALQGRKKLGKVNSIMSLGGSNLESNSPKDSPKNLPLIQQTPLISQKKSLFSMKHFNSLKFTQGGMHTPKVMSRFS